MVDPGIIAAKLAEVQDRIARVRAHSKPTADDLRADRDAQDLIAFNLMLGVQASADLATHIVATERWPVAKSLRDAFDRLRERGVVSEETARAMSDAVGLRNVVAHGYAGVDVGMLHAASCSGLVDLDRLCAEVASWVRGRGLVGGPPTT